MQHFRKYEFTPTKWATLQKEIQIESTNPEGEKVVSWNTDIVAIVVELGKLCLEWETNEEGMQVCKTTATKTSIDIVWQGEPLPSFATSMIWCLPVGVSSMGYTLDTEYAKAYCEANPNAEYCQPPTPIEE